MKKCLVPDCPNTDEQGTFVGNVCKPCYEYISNGGDSLHDNSYARRMRNALFDKHRNEIKKLSEKQDIELKEFWDKMIGYLE
jgi:hypothetical protein